MDKKKKALGEEVVTLKIFISRQIADRIEAYARGISGGKRPNVTAVVRGWIMEKLPEAEANLGSGEKEA